MGYDEDDFLMISGIQHFSFCPRQWALIHIDQVWDENIKTIEGNIVHENCHNPDFVEKRGEFLISRGIRIASRTLGVTGQCDFTGAIIVEVVCMDMMAYGFRFLLNTNEEKRRILMQIVSNYAVKLCV